MEMRSSRRYVIVPLSAFSLPAMTLSSVLFPVPLTPTSAMRSFSSMAKLTSSTIALTFCILLRCSTLTNMISPAHLPQPFGVAVLDPIAIPFAEPERESLITQADESACRIRQRMTLQKLFALREVQLADMPQ